LGKESGPSDGIRDVSLINSANNLADAIDWRPPIINYLHNPSVRIERNVQRTTLNIFLLIMNFIAEMLTMSYLNAWA
jgi:hypothetical protein